jgi:hypothetical protein
MNTGSNSLRDHPYSKEKEKDQKRKTRNSMHMTSDENTSKATGSMFRDKDDTDLSS